MQASKKPLRLMMTCVVLAATALTLTVRRWPAHAQSKQDSVTRSAQGLPARRPAAPPVENPDAPVSVPNAPAATITVNSLADGAPANDGQCTLREALINANNNDQSGSADCAPGSGADSITISVTGTINLTGALPNISENLTINGPGAASLAVRRNTGGDYRIFRINGGVSATFSGMTIANGKTDIGGGIDNEGTLTINNCAVTGNQATVVGGGVLNQGVLNINSTTINANAAADGGGIFNQTPGKAVLINCTVSGNTATSFTGGITNLGDGGPTATLMLNACTVTGNNGVTEGGIATVDNTGSDPANTNLKNTIVANNSSPNLSQVNALAHVVSDGYNLASDNGAGLLTGVGDKVSTDPLLSPLGDYGGPTQTHAPQPGSPAIDAGCPCNDPNFDQRGVKRPVGANPDIGSVEASFGTCAPSIIYPSSLPPGAVGAVYSQQLTATGGTGPYVFGAATGPSLPAGLSLSSGGLISGTPTTAVAQNFSLTVQDQNGCVSTQAFFLRIASDPCQTNADIPIAVGQTVTGRLLPGDCTALFGNGSFKDFYTFNGTAGQQVAISLNSTDFDAYLALGLPDGTFNTQDDNGGGGTNARIPAGSGLFTLPQTGTYRIAASAFTGQTGNYTLSLAGPPNNGLQFYPLPRPVRLVDTRAGQGNCDNVSTPIQAGTSLTTLARTTCEGITIPASAQAVVGNLTVINRDPQNAGYLTIYPDGVSVPLASNMIYYPNRIIANNFTVALSSDGKFNVFGERTIDVVIDISGYFAPPGAGGLYYHPLAKPVRLLDTRPNEGTCDNISTPIAAGTSITTQAHTTCEGLTIPPTAQAVAANATVINRDPQNAGYLTIYPNGVAVPLASNLIYYPGQIISNAFTVSLSAAGEFNIFGERMIDMVVDVAGYYSAELIDANGPGLLFNPLPRPLRILDTRPNEGNCDAVSTPITGGTSIAAPGRLACEAITIPPVAQALLGNATVINQTSQAGYLTLYPDGVAPPLTSNMVYFPGQLLANAFVVGVNGGNGQYRVFAERTLDVVVDVSGYFAP